MLKALLNSSSVGSTTSLCVNGALPVAAAAGNFSLFCSYRINMVVFLSYYCYIIANTNTILDHWHYVKEDQHYTCIPMGINFTWKFLVLMQQSGQSNLMMSIDV